MSFKSSKYIFMLFLIIILISNFFIPLFTSDTSINIENTKKIEYYNLSNTNFCWPIPGYTRISSYFGQRISPTIGASSNHLGIDIPAPEGTNLVAPTNATVVFIGFQRFWWTFNNFTRK